MEKVLIAGSTGYLGSCAVGIFKEHGYYVRALVRNIAKVEPVKKYIDDIFEGQVTRPETLEGVCDDMDYVFSSLGITRQPDKVTYMDVDYGGNKHILDRARKAAVKKFIYTAVFMPAHIPANIEIFRVKEKFVDELKRSGMDYAIIRPTGFFSDMREVFKMALSGRAYLIGGGRYKSNPIDGADLARVCVNALTHPQKEIPCGGPDIYTGREVAELAFSVLGKEPKIINIPEWFVRFVARSVSPFLSSRNRGALEFMLTAFLNDFIAPAHEGKSLKDYFVELAQAV